MQAVILWPALKVLESLRQLHLESAEVSAASRGNLKRRYFLDVKRHGSKLAEDMNIETDEEKILTATSRSTNRPSRNLID